MSPPKTLELLAPAGDEEKLRTVVHYGADAVYLGSSRFSLRAMAGNFEGDALDRAIRYTKEQGRKVYVTVNVFPHNKDLGPLQEHLRHLAGLRPDAVILSDPGTFSMVRRFAPDLPVHVSTQANISNSESARFWESLGARRLVLARELTLEEIREIRARVAVELEVFVHGAVCLSYSGRCYLSSFLAHRAANRGACTNSCRWNYTLMEEKRPGEYMPVYENDRGTYILSPRDLCLIEHLPALQEAGVNSLKVEGRMKGINYAAGVVKTYREALDELHSGRPYRVKERWLRELAMFSSRGYSTGLLLGPGGAEAYNFDEKDVYRMSHELVGVVQSVNGGRMVVNLRNRLRPGDRITCLSPGLEETEIVVEKVTGPHGESLEYGYNGQPVLLDTVEGVRPGDLLRRQVQPAS